MSRVHKVHCGADSVSNLPGSVTHSYPRCSTMTAQTRAMSRYRQSGASVLTSEFISALDHHTQQAVRIAQSQQ